ncbi:MAG: chloride channel protein [Bdellovibrionales bacterium]|nr:chloride channel protein [Bdellovibrionales bacterium]
MKDHPSSSQNTGLPIAPSMELAMLNSNVKKQGSINTRALRISFYAIGLGFVASGIAQGLTRLIGLCTNLFFYHRLSFEFIDPGKAPNWGLWVIGVPVLGGIIVGLMARYGSKAIRGHGIPEAMEQILTNESRIPWRIVFLKPISAAIAIGSGGPFGAEGPIIATGGALGSWLGQITHTTSIERKTLLAAGAAAGMTATFGSPISAVLLAVELLLFEFKPRSLIPVCLASATASALRIAIVGLKPAFVMPLLMATSGSTIAFYGAMGIFIGIAAIVVTKVVYMVEDGFEKLPIHWMWWPALGGIAVGVIGYFFPRTLGVGYENIDAILSGELAPSFIAIFCSMKFLSWAISLGSGTSGGTLAPIFTIGGGIGILIGVAGQYIFPHLNIDLKAAALVGMAALFAGASRALLASVVFAFETTGQQVGLLPLLAGCTVSYVISSYFMKNTIMTEKIARRGVTVPYEYAPDYLETIQAKHYCKRHIVSIFAEELVEHVLSKFESGSPDFSHQGYPVISVTGELVGVITKKDFFKNTVSTTVQKLLKRKPIYIFEEQSLRDAADLMTSENVGRIIVVSRLDSQIPKGIITRSDLLSAHQKRLNELKITKRKSNG